MDLSKRAAAWVTAAIKENEFLHDMTGVMSDYMDVEDTKFAVHLAMKCVPSIVGYFSPELGEGLEAISKAIELAQLDDLVDQIVDNTIDFVALTLEDSGPAEGSMEQELIDILSEMLEDKPEVSLEEQARADEQQQDIEVLQNEFEQDMKDRMETIDKMEERYFKNHQDLSEDERADAEGRFEEIRAEEITSLETQLTSRMAELRAPQQEPREDPEPKRREQERS